MQTASVLQKGGQRPSSGRPRLGCPRLCRYFPATHECRPGGRGRRPRRSGLQKENGRSTERLWRRPGRRPRVGDIRMSSWCPGKLLSSYVLRHITYGVALEITQGRR